MAKEVDRSCRSACWTAPAPAPASGVIAGIDWVAAHHQAGAPGGGQHEPRRRRASQPSTTRCTRLIADGVTVAVAAGNSDTQRLQQLARPGWPAPSPSARPTAPTRARPSPTSARAWTCSRPGVDITSAWLERHATNTISGTSMATPHVAGRRGAAAAAQPGLRRRPRSRAASVAWRRPAGVRPPARVARTGCCTPRPPRPIRPGTPRPAAIGGRVDGVTESNSRPARGPAHQPRRHHRGPVPGPRPEDGRELRRPRRGPPRVDPPRDPARRPPTRSTTARSSTGSSPAS